MKHLYTLLILFAFFSCTKDSEEALNPDLTVGLTGRYPITSYSEGNQTINLPVNGVSGQFDVDKIDQTHVRVKLSFTDAGVTEEWSTNDFELRRDAGNPKLYNLYYDSDNIGTITSTTVDVQASSPDGTVTKVSAKR